MLFRIFCGLIVISGWAVAMHPHAPRGRAIVCNFCSGSACASMSTSQIRTCSASGRGGKCYIRLDTNSAPHWGCIQPGRWLAQAQRPDGCRLLQGGTFGGKGVVLCMCSQTHRCNSNVLELASQFRNSDTDAIKKLLDRDQSVLIPEYAVVFPSNLLRDASKQGVEDNVLNHINKPDPYKASYKFRESYTVPEQLYKSQNQAVNSVVHGAFSQPGGPFMPRYRDCRIHNGYCEHVCVMSWNGMGYCACRDGYSLSRDLKTCTDIDECQSENGGCLHECHNVAGSYYCSCLSGYVMARDNKTCDEVDECTTAARGGCSHGCVNTPGSYACTCPDGLELTGGGRTCQDINECARNDALCQQLCLNTEGAYVCDCTAGFVLSSDGYKCLDKDECAADHGGCNQECINSLGSFSCGCRMGYDFLGEDTITCHDIDECAEENGHCEQFCTNKDGGYDCTCALGYELMEHGRSCHEVIPGDKCVKNNGGCDHECEVVDASTVACLCPHGYELLSNGKACVDADECENNPCEHDCTNSPGSYVCVCRIGYTLLPDDSCVDVDECHVNNGNCADTCINTDGSYFCACSLGYMLGVDGHSCVDVDECEMNNGGCADICQNSLGSYNCSCSNGYVMDSDRSSCFDVDECSDDNYGECEHICVNTAGSYLCGCADGYRLSVDRRSCSDTDECDRNNGGCDQDCVNVKGSFRCECYSGYTIDYNGICRDVDECFYRLDNCTTHCVNTPGSFECACPPGYRVADDNASCEDDDECQNENGGCGQFCYNIVGSYRCACAASSGFVLAPDGHSCQVECPAGFDAVSESCYLVVLDHKRKFEDAEEHCRDLHQNSHLVSFDSESRAAAVTDLAETRLEGVNETLWTAGKYWKSVHNFVWITSYNVISGFNITIPSGLTSQSDSCVVTSPLTRRGFGLVAENCDEEHYVICQINLQS